MRIALAHRLASRLNGGIFFAQIGVLPHLARLAGAASELRAIGGHDVHADEDRARWVPAQVETLPVWPPLSFAYAARWQPALNAFAPDLMHCHGLWAYAGWAVLRHHRRTGCPFLVSPHGMLDPGALRFSRGKKRIMAALFQDAQLAAATAVHALNPAEAETIRAYGVQRPIVVIPNGVDLPDATAVTPPPWKSDPARPRTLLFLGRIHPKKGLEALIEAWITFTSSRPENAAWRLVIGGWDELDLTARLRARVAGTPAAASVEFVPPLWGDEKSAAYRAADAFILPSHSEGLPVTVLEAWAHRKPALITPACHLEAGVEAGAAWSIDPTVPSIVAGLQRLATVPPATLAAMGEAGREFVEARFAWPKIAADLLRVYVAVASRQPLPPDLLYRP